MVSLNKREVIPMLPLDCFGDDDNDRIRPCGDTVRYGTGAYHVIYHVIYYLTGTVVYMHRFMHLLCVYSLLWELLLFLSNFNFNLTSSSPLLNSIHCNAIIIVSPPIHSLISPTSDRYHQYHSY